MATSFDFSSAETWHPVGDVVVYRLLPPRVPYSPEEAWPTTTGRFDLDGVPTLYLSRTAHGAVAEYLRRHPEFLRFQGRLKHELFQITFRGVNDGSDVTTEERAEAVGIAYARLRSSDAKNAVRYAECRALAQAIRDNGGCSIESPSAALEGTLNVVGLGDAGWSAVVDDQIPLPNVDPTLVRPLPSGHEP